MVNDPNRLQFSCEAAKKKPSVIIQLKSVHLYCLYTVYSLYTVAVMSTLQNSSIPKWSRLKAALQKIVVLSYSSIQFKIYSQINNTEY